MDGELQEWSERALDEEYPYLINEELKRRTHVIRIFPNAASCLRLVRALAVEQHEEWLEGARYLDMQPLREQRKETLAVAA